MEALLIIGGIGVLAFSIPFMQIMVRAVVRHPPQTKYSGRGDRLT